ncbi:hypothetical protein [Nocardioides sp.]|uniref:hypothetical protein n=1 Tax=Nocardioides sp. TaxID=35761 RepID=UPI001A353406|nr:hypothetical protein [Nocardioides sp.]MBJ7358014.1 hypothetical protein [Nocardioides sp.]
MTEAYDRLLALADVFDTAAAELRSRAGLGAEVLRDPAVTDTADLAPTTYAQAEEDVRAATTGTHGLMTRSLELDADALVVRATVVTYQWIDELRTVASSTLGSIAGRAVGYLAPTVELGGAVVSAGLIETDALDRDEIVAYLSELAANHPELLDHVTSGGGGLLDGLQLRSLLTAGFVAGEPGRGAARGGLRAIGVAPMRADAAAVVRDVAGPLQDAPDGGFGDVAAVAASTPRSLAELVSALLGAGDRVLVHRTAPSRYLVLLGSPGEGDLGPTHGPRLVGADLASYRLGAVRTIEAALDGDDDARVLLVGAGHGGVLAAELAAGTLSDAFTVDAVVTAGSPSAHVPRVPDRVRVLSLEDRADPVALLGSLVNAGAANRTDVVFDASDAEPGEAYLAGARAADEAAADHPELAAELDRLRGWGYLAP